MSGSDPAMDSEGGGGRATAPKRRGWWTAVQFVLLAVILVLFGREIAGMQAELRATARSITVRWELIAAASAIVLATYAALIQSWRLLMSGWGSTLAFWPAVRIWTIANLGRYVPGKVWSVGAMVVLAQREGVNPVAATGAALLGTLINIGAGFGIVAIAGSGILDALDPRYRAVTMIGTAGFVLGVLLLPWMLPRVLAWLARRRPSLVPPSRPLPSRTIWLAVAINCASWLGYGVAFALLTRAVLPDISGALLSFVAIWTASYLAGYLTLIAPGGLGTREWVLMVSLPALGMAVSADATVLAILSRLWLTVLEVLPGLVSLALAPAAQRSQP
jgi:glycosyltransferase 2 family protein